MNAQDCIRQRITDQIVEALRSGTAPWRRHRSDLANGGLPTNVTSKRHYSGVNPLLLQLVALERNYQSKWWGTFNQWVGLGGRIIKRPDGVEPGAWGTRIVFYKPVTKITVDDDGKSKRSTFPVMREFVVFNVEQVEGAEVDHLRATPDEQAKFICYDPADKVIAATGADIRFGGNQAFYSRTHDYIQMPLKETFDSQHNWYTTTFHELCHWSEQRVQWTASYAMNELVAEIGACYLATQIGVPQSDDLSNHEAYLSHWLGELEGDPKAIFRAATQASRVTDFILAFSRPQEEANAEADEAVACG